jgi:glycosyltransferase involved in cell wall biosynthesis
MALISALLTRAPLLFRGETTDHARPRGRWFSRARDVALRVLYARCSKLMYVGKRSYAHFRRLGCTSERLIFSPYCVDETTFRSDETARQELRQSTRDALGIEPDQLVFLFSGKLVRRKGPDLLLAAIEQATDDFHQRSVAVFLGSGEEEVVLRKQAPSVARRFLGFKNQSELSAIYHASDVLVLPSRTSETWGLVVNEALQHGLPCVVSEDVGCAPDLVQPGHSGEVFVTGSAVALTKALQQVTRLVGDQSARERCRQHVAPYSVAAAASGIAQAYGH